jgi:hypothetical protein
MLRARTSRRNFDGGRSLSWCAGSKAIRKPRETCEGQKL